MVNIQVYRPFYSFSRVFLKKYFSRIIENEFKELDVNVELELKKNQISFNIQGEDWEIVKNFINQKFVILKNIKDIQKDSHFKGFLNSVGDFVYGIYVDIGIRKQIKKYVLIPLYKLRENFFLGNKVSLRYISKNLGLLNNLAVKIKIIDVNLDENKILGNLDLSEIEKYNRWIKNNNEILLFCGVTLTKIQKIFQSMNINKYLVNIDNLDFFEHAVILEEGTTAKGILAKIGKHFKNDISLLSPKNVRALIDST